MSLISLANAVAQMDTMGAIYKKQQSVVGVVANQAAPTVGTIQAWANNLQTLITTSVDDYEQQKDMLDDFHAVLLNANAEAVAKAMLQNGIDTLGKHMNSRGSSVSALITGISTFLSYYNGGGGGSAYNKMATPDFANLYYAIKNSRLAAAGVMSPAIHPSFTSGASANGMASRIVGSSMVAGDDVNTTLYSPVIALLEVTTVFGGGGAPPSYTIVGTDDAGLTTAAWSVTLTGNNPVAAVSTTITPAVNAQSRQTVAIGASTGIVAGSVLVVNAGLVDEETIVVESVGGGPTITAAFQLAHLAGATLTGKSTYTLTPANGARIVHVASITPTLSGHSSGAVRVVGKQDRVGV